MGTDIGIAKQARHVTVRPAGDMNTVPTLGEAVSQVCDMHRAAAGTWRGVNLQYFQTRLHIVINTRSISSTHQPVNGRMFCRPATSTSWIRSSD